MAGPRERALLRGAAGDIEIVASAVESPRVVCVIAHPHPLFGGTMDNKVVTTLARAGRIRRGGRPVQFPRRRQIAGRA